MHDKKNTLLTADSTLSVIARPVVRSVLRVGLTSVYSPVSIILTFH